MNVPSMNNFPSLSNKSPTKFPKFNFSYLTNQVTLFFAEKGNLKFSDFEMWWREGKNSDFDKTLNCT